MPRHENVKINGANGQTQVKNRSSTFVLTAFISFGFFIFSTFSSSFEFPYKVFLGLLT
jgi:hypothetical protein